MLLDNILHTYERSKIELYHIFVKISIITINTVKLAKISYFLFILSLFFPIRHVFFSDQAFITGAYSDFTSYSLYLSDIFILTTWILILPRGENFYHVVEKLKYLIFWLVLAVFWFLLKNEPINWYFNLKILELIVAYGTTLVLFKEKAFKFRTILTIVALSSIQAIIAIIQFYKQTYLGLNKLGEQLISPISLGVAKIVSGETPYIRGYGTFPHPNVLSAFLVTSSFAFLWLFVNSNSFKSKVFYTLGFFINVFGLIITFSRAGYLAFLVGLIFFFSFLLIKTLIAKFYVQNPEIITKLKQSLFITIICIALGTAVYWPFITTRATLSDQSSLDRMTYNKIGLKIIRDNPIFGTGVGESVLHMERYSEKNLEPWEKQPIHNYFLLSASELGIVGFLLILWIFLSHFFSLFKKILSSENFKELGKFVFLATILISFFTLMLFDHYFYTIQQTQMLLWIVLGAIVRQIKNPQEGDFT